MTAAAGRHVGAETRSLRVGLAVAAGRLAGMVSRVAGRGGTALPGLVAERLAPGALAHLARQLPRGVVIVTGTNGKTTTSHLVRDVVARAGWPVIHNATGSNLPRGILGAFMTKAGLGGDLHAAPGTIAILEVDEAALPRVLAATDARVLVVTNLFRDQLDRYGEVDAVRDRWRAALATIDAARRPRLVLNADDPTVAGLADLAGDAGVITFGVADPLVGQDAPDHAADATLCPTCGARLAYDRVTYGHLGAWRCGRGHARPRLDLAARAIRVGEGGTAFDLEVASSPGMSGRRATNGSRARVRLQVPGLYNAYNAIAAAATGYALGFDHAGVDGALEAFRGAFGRFERVAVDGRTVVIVLAKNPVGMNEALRAVVGANPGGDLLVALNDLDADGRDVSWIWDADFEVLAGKVARVTVAGRRAADLAMRLAYAAVGLPDAPDVGRVVVEGIAPALDHALAAAPPGGTVAAVVTYTAMLQLRRVLSDRGHVAPYWEDAGAAKTPAAEATPGLGRGHPCPPVGGAERGHPSAAGQGLPGTRGAGQASTSPMAGRAPRASWRTLRLGHLYGDLLNLYADRGNVIALRRRCAWRGIRLEVVPLGIGDGIAHGEIDLAFMGGGQDGDQAYLADDLFRVKADGLRGLVADGVPLLAVCGSYQLLGHHYDPATGPRLPGLGIFDLRTSHPGPRAPRCIGNVVVEWHGAPPGSRRTLVGFENHGGRTWLGEGATPLARVVAGFGNNGGDGTEGIVVANAIGTYLHGSLLPKNPHLADWLIATALDPSGGTALEPLDDGVEWDAHLAVRAFHAPAWRDMPEAPG